MWKTRLINNAISLAAYAALVALWNNIYVLYRIIPRAFGPDAVITVLGVVILVACGFFLKPVGKRSFLSVISPLVASVLIFIYFMFQGGEDALGYLAFNPFAFSFGGLEVDGVAIMVLLSPIIPSLLLYAGVLLRKLWAKNKTGRILAIAVSIAVLAACVVSLMLSYNENSKRTKFVSETPDMWFVQHDPFEDYTYGQLMLNGQPIELVVYGDREYPPTLTFTNKNNEYEEKLICTYYYVKYPDEVLTIYIDRESDTLLNGQYSIITFKGVRFKP